MRLNVSSMKGLLFPGALLLTSLTFCQYVSCMGSFERQEHTFGADVNKMMDIIIHSLYKSNEIFLRELIANASDALDKLRQVALTNRELLEDHTLDIKIHSSSDGKKLIIHDSGIGMTQEDLINNLGNIGSSGTKKFIEQFSEKSDSNLIGQFGVGFYSSFLAGDKVEVITKTFSGEKLLWTCENTGTYTVEHCPQDADLEDPIVKQGTKVIIHLKSSEDDTTDYSSEATLKELIHRYSEFINFPIYLLTRTTKSEEVPLTDSELEAENQKEQQKAEEKKEGEEDIKVEDAEDKKDEEKPKKTTKTVSKTVEEYVLVNDNKPIWTRDPTSVTQEEYVQFYKSFTNDSKEPHDYSHFKVEGATTDFRGLIYIPKTPSFQLLSNDTPVDFLKLFVKRVFISSDFPDFPRYLSFVKALVDADDIPLNVSRETLQKTKAVQNIKKSVIAKTIALINKMSKNETAYLDFYNTYANNLKLGVISDQENGRKAELAGLLRFHSSALPAKNMTSFDDYISRMKTNQTDIYYVSGTDVYALKRLPYVESLLKRGLEVLLMVDTYDEYTIQALPSYKDHSLKNVAKGGIQFADETEDEKKLKEETTTRFKPLTDYLQKLFSKRIEKVAISNLLDTSPMAIVANTFGWSPAMEKLMASSGNGAADPMTQFFGKQKKVIEINPSHPLMEGLLQRVSDGSEPSKELEGDVRLLYDAALMHSGYELKNPAAFAHRVEDMIRAKYGVEPLSEAIKLTSIEIEEESNPMDAFASMSAFEKLGGMGGSSGGMPNMDDFNFDNMPDFDAPHSHSEGEMPVEPVQGEEASKADVEKDEL